MIASKNCFPLISSKLSIQAISWPSFGVTDPNPNNPKNQVQIAEKKGNLFTNA
jgi:hypothetical protein